MFKKISVISLVLSLAFAGVISAHPGRTDANGGHTCRTNCEKWGLSYGEYHYHNGGSSSSSSSSSTKTDDVKSEAEKNADRYIWQGDYYLKQNNYYNALYYYLKADETGYGWKTDTDHKSNAAKKIADQAKVYFKKDQLAKAKQFYDLLSQDSQYSRLYDVPKNIELIKSRQAFLNAFGSARWYAAQKSYINAVLLADKAMKEGLANNPHAIQFMEENALKLAQQAYRSFLDEDYETSLKQYRVLANAEYVPTKLKEGAVKNVNIVEKKMDEGK